MSALWCHCHSWWAHVSGSSSGQGEFTNNCCGVLIRRRHFSPQPPAQHFFFCFFSPTNFCRHRQPMTKGLRWASSDCLQCGAPICKLQWNVSDVPQDERDVQTQAPSFMFGLRKKKTLSHFHLGRKEGNSGRRLLNIWRVVINCWDYPHFEGMFSSFRNVIPIMRPC